MQSPPVIVQLCTFTIAKPIHGGQRRVLAIYEALHRAAFHVHYIGMYSLDDSPSESFAPNDFARPSRMLFTQGSMLLDDFNQGHFLASDDVTFARLAAQIRSYKPDIIQIEHPWLWPVVKRLKQDFSDLAAVRFIYSSHNIEWRLKASILQQYQVPSIDTWAAAIRELEAEAATAADLVLAVTTQDAIELKELGARNVVVLKNGMEKRQLPPLSPDAAKPFALFIASGHPPNVRGFLECLGPYLAFLPPSVKIRIVGGVGTGLRDHPDYRLYRELNDSRLEFMGEASEDVLLQSLADCRCIILPIIESSGSNLKTAEALLARKTIVATRTAMRGFEEFLQEDNVTICENPDEFKKTVQRMLTTRLGSRSVVAETDEGKLESLTWPAIMKPLPNEVKALLR